MYLLPFCGLLCRNFYNKTLIFYITFVSEDAQCTQYAAMYTQTIFLHLSELRVACVYSMLDWVRVWFLTCSNNPRCVPRFLCAFLHMLITVYFSFLGTRLRTKIEAWGWKRKQIFTEVWNSRQNMYIKCKLKSECTSSASFLYLIVWHLRQGGYVNNIRL